MDLVSRAAYWRLLNWAQPLRLDRSTGKRPIVRNQILHRSASSPLISCFNSELPTPFNIPYLLLALQLRLITILLPSSTTLRSPLKTTRVFIPSNQVTSQAFSLWTKQIELLKPLCVKALSSALRSVWEFLPRHLLLEVLNALLIFTTQLSDYFHTAIPISERLQSSITHYSSLWTTMIPSCHLGIFFFHSWIHTKSSTWSAALLSCCTTQTAILVLKGASLRAVHLGSSWVRSTLVYPSYLIFY